jgi:mono/diheme cytochrome c family protein
VAFNPLFDEASDGSGIWFAVQTREPAQLLLYRDVSSPPRVVDLGGASALNSGHEIFHRDTGLGIACAVCHAEGAEDGRVWKFVLAAPPWALFGERRTQAINSGLEGTEPFHWVGDMADMNELVHEVLVGRMGGQEPSIDRVWALERWLYTLTPPAPIVDSTAPEATRGRALFESSIVGCANCHSGEKLTNNQNYDVGVEPGQTFQVPSLRGIGYRAPFLHDGCAATLLDRFAPPCGSDFHGNTSHLSSAEIDDIIAYLQSL